MSFCQSRKLVEDDKRQELSVGRTQACDADDQQVSLGPQSCRKNSLSLSPNMRGSCSAHHPCSCLNRLHHVERVAAVAETSPPRRDQDRTGYKAHPSRRVSMPSTEVPRSTTARHMLRVFWRRRAWRRRRSCRAWAGIVESYVKNDRAQIRIVLQGKLHEVVVAVVAGIGDRLRLKYLRPSSSFVTRSGRIP